MHIGVKKFQHGWLLLCPHVYAFKPIFQSHKVHATHNGPELNDRRCIRFFYSREFARVLIFFNKLHKLFKHGLPHEDACGRIFCIQPCNRLFELVLGCVEFVERFNLVL